jgi:hypothetical protein
MKMEDNTKRKMEHGSEEEDGGECLVMFALIGTINVLLRTRHHWSDDGRWTEDGGTVEFRLEMNNGRKEEERLQHNFSFLTYTISIYTIKHCRIPNLLKTQNVLQLRDKSPIISYFLSFSFSPRTRECHPKENHKSSRNGHHVNCLTLIQVHS